MKITAIAFDEGGTIWEGKKSYDSIELLLEDAEAGKKMGELELVINVSI